MARASKIEILLEIENGVARPGQTLRGGFRINTPQPVFAKKAELSVLWYTEGKGNEDEGVVHFESIAEQRELDAGQAFPFEARLPDFPWSYDGKIVKIRWAVRVRIQPDPGEEIAGEQRFLLLPEGREAPVPASTAKPG